MRRVKDGYFVRINDIAVIANRHPETVKRAIREGRVVGVSRRDEVLWLREDGKYWGAVKSNIATKLLEYFRGRG